jgi:hypothetical protein
VQCLFDTRPEVSRVIAKVIGLTPAITRTSTTACDSGSLLLEVPVTDKIGQNAAARRDVMMIDAGKGFIKDSHKNWLRDQDIHGIVDTFRLAGCPAAPVDEITNQRAKIKKGAARRQPLSIAKVRIRRLRTRPQAQKSYLLYAVSPCELMSRPSRSSSSVTRRPIVRSTSL